jgi:hypothetical protein
MQDISNLRWSRGNKMFAKRHFTIKFIHLIHNACQILFTFTNQCLCLHLHCQCLHLTHSHTSSLSFHNISSLVPSTSLDIQHFFKSFTVTFGEMYCVSVMIHNDQILCLYFLVYKLTWTCEESQFSPQNLNICVLDFHVVSVVWSVWAWLFLWFLICG